MRRLALLVLLILVGLGLWTWLTLAWAYSDGERAGVLQRFSHKGWVCKTYEGEIAFYYGGGQYLAPGTSPQMWEFSVRDKTVAAQLDKAVGHRVQLHYTEHRGVPLPTPTPSAPPASLPDVRPGATISPPPLPPKP